MKTYKNRGSYFLFYSKCCGVNGLILMLFEKTRPLGAGQLFLALVLFIPLYFIWRKLTPEQYERYRKSNPWEQLPSSDERDLAISGRVCEAGVMVLTVSLTVGAEVAFLAFDNKPIALAMAAQLGILLITLFIALTVYRRKM